jgi:hypothetical protein
VSPESALGDDASGASRVRGLVDRADWSGLWQLAQELPLIEAVTALRLIDDHWRPAGGTEQALLGRLASTSTSVLAEGREDLRPRTRSLLGSPAACGFAADGRTLAVAENRPDPFDLPVPPWDGHPRPQPPRSSHWLAFELPGGTQDARRWCRYPSTSSMAFAGDTAFGVTHRSPPFYIGVAAPQRTRLVRWTPGRRVRTIQRLPGSARIFPRRDGFVLTYDRRGQTWVRCYDAARNVTSETALTVGLPGDVVRLLGVSPASGHLVVETRGYAADVTPAEQRYTRTTGRVWLMDGTGCQVLASSPSAPRLSHMSACFPAEDRLLTVHHLDGLTLWGMADGTLEPLATAPAAWIAVPSATHATIVTLAMPSDEDRMVRICYRDPATLAPVSVTTEPSGTGTSRLWRSPLPAGPLVYGSPVGVTIVSATAEAAAVADRPPVSWAPPDLAAVTSAAGDPSLTQAGRELLGVLHDWLRHRLDAAGDPG